MKDLKLLPALVCIIFLALTSCEDNAVTNELEPIEKSGVNRGFPGGPNDESGGTDDYCPYPDIYHTEFAPEDLYSMKSLVWRITWPDCYNKSDEDEIPTAFIPNGALYSSKFLNGVDPQNTYNSVFSLYLDNTIKKTSDMGNVLNFANNPPAGSMETVIFKIYEDGPPPIEHIQMSVVNSPGGLVHHYLNADVEVDELAYQEGDILTFQLSGPEYTRYGVIWIKSMSPRIIDVYMTAKGNGPSDDIGKVSR